MTNTISTTLTSILNADSLLAFDSNKETLLPFSVNDKDFIANVTFSSYGYEKSCYLKVSITPLCQERLGRCKEIYLSVSKSENSNVETFFKFPETSQFLSGDNDSEQELETLSALSQLQLDLLSFLKQHKEQLITVIEREYTICIEEYVKEVASQEAAQNAKLAKVNAAFPKNSPEQIEDLMRRFHSGEKIEVLVVTKGSFRELRVDICLVGDKIVSEAEPRLSRSWAEKYIKNSRYEANE